MSSFQPTLPAVVVDLEPTFEWLFIGVVSAGVFYGVTVVQTLFYFQTYPNDRIFLKGLVITLWILDTLSLILTSRGTYTWLVTGFCSPLGLNKTLWTIAAEPLCKDTIVLCVHLFMAHRIYILNRKLALLAIAIAVASFVPFGVGIYVAFLGLTTPGGFALLTVKLHPSVIVATVFITLLDLVIAATLVMILRRHSSQTHLKGTDRMISLLTIYLVANNLLTSFITTSVLITVFAAPKTLVYEGIMMLVSKAYTNTFLAQLNARQSIQGKGTLSTQQHSDFTASPMKNTEPIAFGLGSISDGTSSNSGELVFEARAADPTIVSVAAQRRSSISVYSRTPHSTYPL